MAGKGSSASKGLLAVGIRALVRALSGVCPAMSGQRAAVAEGLGCMLAIETRNFNTNGTNLCASLAVVRLLSSVHALMHCQGRPLDKLLAAVGPVANMRSDTAVDALCSC